MILQRLTVGPLRENVYIVGDEATKECMVVDPGDEGNKILEEIERLGLKASLIVITHGHVDHIGAIALVKERTGAKYAIHPADLPFVKNARHSAIISMFPDFRDLPEPDIQIKDGDALTIGLLKFTILATPGHTPGSVCIHGEGVVFTGDTLFRASIGRYDFPGGDGRKLLNSIFSKLLTLADDTRVLPGHGPESTIGWEKQNNPFLTGRFIVK